MIKERNGISLVALIITIIVLIILAGTVIITMNNENIIGKANLATDLNDLDVLKSAYMMEKSNDMIEGKDNKMETLENAAKLCNMNKDFNFIEGKVKYIGKNTSIQSWVLENFVLEGYFCTRIGEEIYITGLDTEEKRQVSGITNKEYTVFNNESQQVIEGNMTTGYQIKDGETLIGKIVYFGDINKDGEVTVLDIDTGIFSMPIENMNSTTMDVMLAIDVDHNGIITYKDLTTILTCAINSTKRQQCQNERVVELKEYERLLDSYIINKLEISNDTIFTEKSIEIDGVDTKYYEVKLNQDFTVSELNLRKIEKLGRCSMKYATTEQNAINYQFAHASKQNETVTDGYFIELSNIPEIIEGNKVYTVAGDYSIYIKIIN